MDVLQLTGNALHKSEMEYHGNFGHDIGSIQHIACMSRIDIFTQPVIWQPKLWHQLFLVSKAKSAVFNIFLVNIANPYFILLTHMMAQMP